jgi:hypothetical protein
LAKVPLLFRRRRRKTLAEEQVARSLEFSVAIANGLTTELFVTEIL